MDLQGGEQQQIDQMFEIGIDVDDFNITVNNSNADFLVPLVDNASLSFDEQTSQLILRVMSVMIALDSTICGCA